MKINIYRKNKIICVKDKDSDKSLFIYLCWFYDNEQKITYQIYLCSNLISTLLKYNYYINNDHYRIRNINDYKLLSSHCILHIINNLNNNNLALGTIEYYNIFLSLLNMALYNE